MHKRRKRKKGKKQEINSSEANAGWAFCILTGLGVQITVSSEPVLSFCVSGCVSVQVCVHSTVSFYTAAVC